MMRLFFLLFLLCPYPSFSEQHRLPAEEIVVTANTYPVPFENLSRSVAVFTQEDIAALPVSSVADVLAIAVSADIESRSPFGMQSDIKLRGSSFSQVLVLVDGMRINDSQTGHHNADFPLPLQDIERVEVLLGSGSSVYGADAFGGVVNIITKRNSKGVRASVSGGQNDLMEGYFSVGFQKGKYGQSISASGSRSSGFKFDRDFRNVSVNTRASFGDRSTLFVSHVNKEFGSDQFYGPAPSREWTNQTLISFEQKFEGKSGVKGTVQSFYRTHGDQFYYDQSKKDGNSHRTHSIGLVAKAQVPITDAGSITLGMEAGGDWINSNRLGDHSYARNSFFAELHWNLLKKIDLYSGLRLDHYSNFGSAVSPTLSGSWWVLPRLRLRSSVGHAFRIPSFTELYYSDAIRQADSELKPEKAWSAEAGADFIPAKSWLSSFTFFSRNERNVIDWIRLPGAPKWQTSNIRELRTDGFEISLERTLGAQARVEAHYSHIVTDAGKVNYESKYALDYARHTWVSSAHFPLLFSLQYQQTLTYKERSDGRSHWLLNSGLERPFHKFVAEINYANLLNSTYEEVRGVIMPGRWFVLTLRTK
jgi:iron complex outermembrane receptor protein